MKLRKSLPMFLAVSLMALILPAAAMAVQVSAECAYTASDVICEVYVDTAGDTGNGLRSTGIRLTYNTSDLTFNGGSINDTDWFFGAGSSEYPTPNSISDSVVDGTNIGYVDIVVGKLDNTNPATTGIGVTGARVLVAENLSFTRNTTNPVVITAEAAHGGTPFVSVVDAASGNPLAAGFGATVAQRGDANLSGTVDISDARVVRNIFLGSEPPTIWADCTGEGTVDITDARCIRDVFLGL